MRRAPISLTLAVALACLLAPAGVQASVTQESMFQDDNELEFSPPAKVAETLDRLKALGVDRLRVSVFWASVAPSPTEATKPTNFDATDPDAYPQTKWERYDTLVRLAAERGMGIMWDVTSPAPNWATGTPAQRKDLDEVWYPKANEFGAFVRAVATRYSGAYIRPADRPQTVDHPAQGTPGLPGYKPAYTTTTPAGAPIGRVATWEIWNEPNQGAWLAPQHTLRTVSGRKRWVPTSPRIYRRLADAMYGALNATGHGADTILLGSTAPKGANTPGVSRAMKPATFISELYCVDGHNQPYRGRAAEIRGCPKTDPIAQLPLQHPVLFNATGFSHHPYELTFSPSTPPPDPKYFTIANLDELSRTLRYAYLRYRQPVPPTGIPLYLTEFGYQTNPPDRIGVSLAKQATYIDQAEYMVWRNPAVRALSQFLLVDGGDPVTLTFQTGLLFHDGRAKPALRAYRLPIWLPTRRIRPGAQIPVWGFARAAPNGTAPQVAIQYRRPGAKSFATLVTRGASPERGYLYERVRVPGAGQIRLLFDGQVSRTVTVRAR